MYCQCMHCGIGHVHTLSQALHNTCVLIIGALRHTLMYRIWTSLERAAPACVRDLPPKRRSMFLLVSGFVEVVACVAI